MMRTAPVLVAALACTPAAGGADTKATADEAKAVRARLDVQVEAWNRGDLEGFMATPRRQIRAAFV